MPAVSTAGKATTLSCTITFGRTDSKISVSRWLTYFEPSMSSLQIGLVSVSICSIVGLRNSGAVSRMKSFQNCPGASSTAGFGFSRISCSSKPLAFSVPWNDSSMTNTTCTPSRCSSLPMPTQLFVGPYAPSGKKTTVGGFPSIPNRIAAGLGADRSGLFRGQDTLAGAQRVDVVRMADHRLRDVTDRNSGGRAALLAAVVGVAVKDDVRARVVNRLRQQVAAEGGIDLQPLAFQGGFDRRIVQQRDFKIDVQAAQGVFQAGREFFRMAHEGLHLRLTEVRPMGATEAATEALGSGHADPRAVDLHRRRLALEHPGAGVLEHLADLVFLVGLVVMVAQDRDHRDAQLAQIASEDLDLIRATAAGEVTGKHQQVGAVGQMLQARPQDAGRADAVVQVADGGDPNHATGSSPSGSVAGTTVVSFKIW